MKRSATGDVDPGAHRDPTPSRMRALQDATRRLCAADPVLADLVLACGALPDTHEGRPDRTEHYGALLRAIVGQQLSVTAARSIYGRLLERYAGRPPTPEQVLGEEPEQLRAAVGLSRAKVLYLRSLAEHVSSGALELEMLEGLSDEEVLARLTAVKGLGEWTAHMFLIFQLERPDVLPIGDLGIRRAIERAYSLEELPDSETVTRLGERWRPHRTLACRYLWRSLKNEPA